MAEYNPLDNLYPDDEQQQAQPDPDRNPLDSFYGDAPQEEEEDDRNWLQRLIGQFPTAPERTIRAYKEHSAASKFRDAIDSLMETNRAVASFADKVDERGYLREDAGEMGTSPMWADANFPQMKQDKEGRILGTTDKEIWRRLNDGEKLGDIVKKTDEEVQEHLDYARKVAATKLYNRPEHAKVIQEAMDKEDFTWRDRIDILTSPEALFTVTADSFLPSALIGLYGFVGGAVMGGGTALLTRSPSMTVSAARTGQAVATYMASADIERKRNFLEGMLNAGVNVFEVASLREFIDKNPERVKEIMAKADYQGGIVGLGDAVSMGAAGLFLGQARKRGQHVKELAVSQKRAVSRLEQLTQKGVQVAAGTAEVATQGALGMYSEVASKAVYGDHIDDVEAWLEFIGEFGLGGFEIGTAYARDTLLTLEEQAEQKAAAEEKKAEKKRKKRPPTDTKTTDEEVDRLVEESNTAPRTDEDVEEQGEPLFTEEEVEESEQLAGEPVPEQTDEEKFKGWLGDAKQAIDNEKEQRKKKRAAAKSAAKPAETKPETPAGPVAPTTETSPLQETVEEGAAEAAAAVEEAAEPAPTAERSVEDALAGTEEAQDTGVPTLEEAGIDDKVAELEVPTEEEVNKRVEEAYMMVASKGGDFNLVLQAAGLDPASITDPETGEIELDPVQTEHLADFAMEHVNELEAIGAGEMTLDDLAPTPAPIEETTTPQKQEAKPQEEAKSAPSLDEVEQTISGNTVVTEAEKATKPEPEPDIDPEAQERARVKADLEKETRLAALRVADEEAKEAAQIEAEKAQAAEEIEELREAQRKSGDKLTAQGVVDLGETMKGFRPLEASQRVYRKAIKRAAAIFDSVVRGKVTYELLEAIVPAFNAMIIDRAELRPKSITKNGTRGTSNWKWEMLNHVNDDGTLTITKTSLNEDGSERPVDLGGQVWEYKFDPSTRDLVVLDIKGPYSGKLGPGDTLPQGRNSTGRLLAGVWTKLVDQKPHLLDLNKSRQQLGQVKTMKEHVAQAVADAREARKLEDYLWNMVAQSEAEGTALLEMLKAKIAERDSLKPGAEANAVRDEIVELKKKLAQADARTTDRRRTALANDSRIKSDAEARQEAMGAQKATREMYERVSGLEYVNVAEYMPEDSKFIAGDDIVLMDTDSAVGIRSQTLDAAMAVQILPDGTSRVIELRANPRGKSPGYSAMVTGSSSFYGSSFEPVDLGMTKFPIDKGQVKKFEEIAKKRKLKLAKEGRDQGHTAKAVGAKPASNTEQRMSDEEAEWQAALDNMNRKRRTGAQSTSNRLRDIANERSQEVRDKRAFIRELVSQSEEPGISDEVKAELEGMIEEERQLLTVLQAAHADASELADAEQGSTGASLDDNLRSAVVRYEGDPKTSQATVRKSARTLPALKLALEAARTMARAAYADIQDLQARGARALRPDEAGTDVVGKKRAAEERDGEAGKFYDKYGDAPADGQSVAEQDERLRQALLRRRQALISAVGAVADLKKKIGQAERSRTRVKATSEDFVSQEEVPFRYGQEQKKSDKTEARTAKARAKSEAKASRSIQQKAQTKMAGDSVRNLSYKSTAEKFARRRTLTLTDLADITRQGYQGAATVLEAAMINRPSLRTKLAELVGVEESADKNVTIARISQKATELLEAESPSAAPQEKSIKTLMEEWMAPVIAAAEARERDQDNTVDPLASIEAKLAGKNEAKVGPAVMSEEQERQLLGVGYFAELAAELRSRRYGEANIVEIFKRIIMDKIDDPDVRARAEELAITLAGQPTKLDAERNERQAQAWAREVNRDIDDALVEANTDGTLLNSLSARSLSMLEEGFKGGFLADNGRLPGWDSLRQMPYWLQMYRGSMPEGRSGLTANEQRRILGYETEEDTQVEEAPEPTGTIEFKVPQPRKPLPKGTKVTPEARSELRQDIERLEAAGAKPETQEDRAILALPDSSLLKQLKQALDKSGKKAGLIRAQEAYNELMKTKGTQFNSGVDPREMMAAVKLTMAYLETGMRALPEITSIVVAELNAVRAGLGDRMRPYMHDVFNMAMDSAVRTGVLNQRQANENAVPEAKKGLKAEIDKLRTDTLPEERDKVEAETLRTESAVLKPTLVGKLNPFRRGYNYWVKSTGKFRENIADSMTRAMEQARGRINSLTEEMKMFQPRYDAILEKNGIVLGSPDNAAMDAAVNMMMGGTRQESAEAKHGVTIPQELADLVKDTGIAISELSTDLLESSIIPEHIKGAIEKNLGMYLHKSFLHTPSVLTGLSEALTGKKGDGMSAAEKIADTHPALMQQILHYGRLYHNLPTSREGFKDLPLAYLRNLFGGNNALVTLPEDNELGGRGFRRQKIRKNRSTGKNELVFDRDGQPVYELVPPEKASRAMLIDYLLSDAVINDEEIDKYTDTMLRAVFMSDNQSDIAAGAVTEPTSAKQKRKVLFTERQQMQEMLDFLKGSSAMSKEFRKMLRNDDQRKEILRMSRQDFIETVERMPDDLVGPGIKDIMMLKEHEFLMNDYIRAGLEEVINPSTQLVDTAAKVGGLLAMGQAVNEMIKIGVRSGELSIGKDTDTTLHTHALGVVGKISKDSKTSIIPGFAGMRFDMGDDRSGGLFDEKTGAPVIFGNKDAIEAIHDLLGVREKEIGRLTTHLYGLSALAKYNAVILNPLAHPRNAFSSLGIGLVRGIVPGFTRGAYKKGHDVAVSQLFGAFGKRGRSRAANKLHSKPELMEAARLMNKYGVSNNAVRQGVMRDLLDSLQGLPDNEFMQALSGSTHVNPNLAAQANTTQSPAPLGTKEQRIDLYVRQAIERAAQGVSGVANEAFRLEDEAIKGIAWLQRSAQFLELAPPVTGDMSGVELVNAYLDVNARASLDSNQLAAVEQAMEAAAVNVTDTFPTFSKVSPGVRALSRFPLLGAFPSFNYEMIRNTKNHYKFAVRLLLKGELPGNIKLSGANKANARKMGMKLFGGALLGHTAQLGTMALFNAMSLAQVGMRRGGQDDDDDFLERNIANQFISSLGSPIQNYQVHAFKNVLPDWYADSMLAVLPGSIDTTTHSFKAINMGWLVAEGAMWEQGFGFISDVMELASGDKFSDYFSGRMGEHILKAAFSRMGGIYANPEVLMREFTTLAQRSDTAAEYKSDASFSQAKKEFNQYMREMAGTFDDPSHPNYGEASEPAIRFAAAWATALATNIPPMAMIRSIMNGADNVYTASELRNDPLAMITEVTAKGLKASVGVREIEFNYETDYPKKLSFSHIPEFQLKRRQMIKNLIMETPSTDYTRDEFRYAARKLYTYHEAAYDNIARGIELGRKLGVDEDLMESVWMEGTGKDASGMFYDTYSLETFAEEGFEFARLTSYEEAGLTKWAEENGIDEDELERRLERFQYEIEFIEGGVDYQREDG